MKDVIRAARLEKNLSQAELAEKLNVTQATISYWETGENLPPTKTLSQLADVLGIPIEKLFEKGDG